MDTLLATLNACTQRGHSTRGQNHAAAFAEANPRAAWRRARSAHDDFVAILEELPLAAVAKRDWFGAAPCALEETAARVLGRA